MCTGKSFNPRAVFKIVRVYPRVYGEILQPNLPAEGLKGLPPCVRGNRICACVVVIVVRSTPVCTGKSQEDIRGLEWMRVYPRVYGEICLSLCSLKV